MNDDLLTRYVTGECSAAERRKVERWATEDPSRRAQLEELQALWAAAEKPARRWDVEVAWRRASARIQAGGPSTDEVGRNERENRSARRRGRRRAARLPPLMTALAIALAVGASLWLYAPEAEGPAAELSKVVRTQPAEQARVRLPDGTIVHVNVDSRIEYPEAFAAGTRTVRLGGEAYFEVTPSADRPFRVVTAGSVTRVVGTAFSIASRGDTASTRVAVREGRVAIRGRGDSVQLEVGAGELGAVSPSGQLTRRRPRSIAHHFRWVDGELAFRAAPLREVAARLGRWYGADVRIADPSIAGRRLTATFRGETLDEALSAMALSLGVRPERDGDVVTLHDAAPDEQSLYSP